MEDTFIKYMITKKQKEIIFIKYMITQKQKEMIFIKYIIRKKIAILFLAISIVLSYSAPINAQQAGSSSKSAKTIGQNSNLIQCLINGDAINSSNTSSYDTDENSQLVSYSTIKIGRINTINSTVALDTASYEIKAVNDIYYIPFTPVLDSVNKSLTLHVNTILLDNTKHMVIIKDAKDANGDKIDSDIIFTFTTGDSTAPFVKEFECFTVNEFGKIIINFSEPMNEAQMLDKSNYMVATTSGAICVPLGTDDTVTKISNKSVLIDMTTTVNKPNVMISPITDLSGKTLNASTEKVNLNAISEGRVLIKSAELIAKNKVKVTFNSKLAVYSNTDISLTGVTEGAIRIAYIESIIVNGNDNTEIVLVLDKEMGTDATYNGSAITATTSQNPRSESVFGTRLMPSQIIPINDKVAPEVITYDHDSNDLTEPIEKVVASGDILTSTVDGMVAKDTTGTITISYSEAINLYSLSILTYVVEGYTVTSISNGANNNEIVLSIKANSDNTPAKTTVRQDYNICDYYGNISPSGKTLTVR